MSGLTAKVHGGAGVLGAGGTATFGPDPVLGSLIALVWGVAGGALGCGEVEQGSETLWLRNSVPCRYRPK